MKTESASTFFHFLKGRAKRKEAETREPSESFLSWVSHHLHGIIYGKTIRTIRKYIGIDPASWDNIR